ncbi:MAG: hypothetical protein IJT77_15365 [Clostridia bacterium]|nr:hypothetical protein [Clostridia bacterium]
MSISFSETDRVFSLRTDHTLYQMKAADGNVLLHLYYGPDTDMNMSYLIRCADRGFSGNPYGMRDNRGFSLDALPLEYASGGVGDYRTSAVRTVGADGSRCADLRYVGYRISEGREPLPGLPYVREDKATETLTVLMRDDVTGLMAELNYHVFPRHDVICRSVRFINTGREDIVLERRHLSASIFHTAITTSCISTDGTAWNAWLSVSGHQTAACLSAPSAA